MCLSCSGDSQVICTKLVNSIIYVDQPGCLLALTWRDWPHPLLPSELWWRVSVVSWSTDWHGGFSSVFSLHINNGSLHHTHIYYTLYTCSIIRTLPRTRHPIYILEQKSELLCWNIFPRRVSACSSSCCSSWPRPSPLLPGQLLNWFLTEILIFQPSPSTWLAQGEYFKTIF